jgi:MHS family citrate/tricarballylate:H+ symporter-like MFS transporter
MAAEIGRRVTAVRPRAIVAATVGNALEFYDFSIYGLFAVQIGEVFFPARNAYVSLMLSLATFGVGFLSRPLGAILLGAYADRVGRRPAMVVSLAMIGISMLVLACIPSYARIGIAAPVLAVIARLVQGFSLGGEVGANSAFLVEAAPEDRRAEIVSWQGVSQAIALVLGSLVATVLAVLLSPSALGSYGWRIAFLIGAAIVPCGYWLRRDLSETLHEQAAQSGPAAGDGALAQELRVSGRWHLALRHWKPMVFGLMAIAAGTVGTYIFVYIATYAQTSLHLPPRAGFLASLAGYGVEIPCILLGGRLSDRYGRKPVNVWGNLAFLLGIYPAFVWVIAARSVGALIGAMVLLNAAYSLRMGSFYAAFMESLPPRIRSGGFGTVYAAAVAVFGGTTQLIVTWIIHITGSEIAPAWYLIGFTLIGQIAYMLYPETAPVRLRAQVARARSRAGMAKG